MKKLKVLMLGWEFPPVISGGLGVACYGIAKELAKKVDLTLIIPQSSTKFQLDNLRLVGLNQPGTFREVKETTVDLTVFDKIDTIKTDIDPYSHEYSAQEVLSTQKEITVSDTSMKIEGNIFSSDELYGLSIDEKVKEYTKQVVRLAQNSDFDVIYAHDWMTFVAGIELKKRFQKPLVLHVHSLSYDRAGVEDRSWVYAIERLGLAQADVIIPVSYYTGRICTQHYGADFKKVFPVHNGVEEVNPFSEPKNFPEKLVLFLGRITAQKGPEVFLEVAKKVLAKNPNVRFVMAGAGDQLKDIIKEGAFKELGNKFHFTGFLEKEQVQKVLAMADVYCMPSISEPFGLSAVEAVQFGIPTVISKQSGVAEVLSGVLKADYWDTNLMANHILDLLTDDELKNKVVKQSAKDLKNLTWGKAVDKIVAVLERVG